MWRNKLLSPNPLDIGKMWSLCRTSKLTAHGNIMVTFENLWRFSARSASEFLSPPVLIGFYLDSVCHQTSNLVTLGESSHKRRKSFSHVNPPSVSVVQKQTNSDWRSRYDPNFRAYLQRVQSFNGLKPACSSSDLNVLVQWNQPTYLVPCCVCSSCWF